MRPSTRGSGSNPRTALSFVGGRCPKDPVPAVMAEKVTAPRLPWRILLGDKTRDEETMSPNRIEPVFFTFGLGLDGAPIESSIRSDARRCSPGKPDNSPSGFVASGEKKKLALAAGRFESASKLRYLVLRNDPR
jgi:hypothetical protein